MTSAREDRTLASLVEAFTSFHLPVIDYAQLRFPVVVGGGGSGGGGGCGMGGQFFFM